MKTLKDYNTIKNNNIGEIRNELENNFYLSCDKIQRFLDTYFIGMGLEITKKIFNDDKIEIVINQVNEDGENINDFNSWI